MEWDEILWKLFISLLVLGIWCVLCGIGIAVMINGYGVPVESWTWVLGGLAAQLGITFLLQSITTSMKS